MFEYGDTVFCDETKRKSFIGVIFSNDGKKCRYGLTNNATLPPIGNRINTYAPKSEESLRSCRMVLIERVK